MKTVTEKAYKENKSKTAADNVLQKRNKKRRALQFELPQIEADRPRLEKVIQRAGLEPGSLSPQEVLQLHSTLGNQAVGRLLAGPLQKKENENQNKTGMPDHLKSGIEQLSGIDMSDVQVHYNSSKPARLYALAYTQGTEIHVAPGQERHLPHEAWHVVQQKQGRVKPTMQIDEIEINDDVGLEKESEVMGAKAYYHSFPTPVQKMGGNRAPGNNRMSNVEPRTQGKENNTGLKHFSTSASRHRTSQGGETTAHKAGVIIQRYTIENLSQVNHIFLSTNQLALYNRLLSYRDEVKYIVGLSAKAEDVAVDSPAFARDIRAKRLTVRNQLEALAKYIRNTIPEDIFAMTPRGGGGKVDQEATKYENYLTEQLIEIQNEIRIAAQPTRRFEEFMGDTRAMEDYYTGESKSHAIPIYWYKQKSDYKDIMLNKPDEAGETRFSFPHGPIIKVDDDTEYELEVSKPDALEKGKVYRNLHLYNDRGIQQKVRRLLIEKYGFNHAGKDVDHIQDLGFEGVDDEDNLWPLDEKINRRPFTGWRTLYGINYINSAGEGKTGTLASLQNKYFRIKAFTGDEGAVPREGVKPDTISGTDY